MPSELLTFPLPPALGARLVTEARCWKGVPFKHQGRSRNGVDCVGLLRMIGLAAGADVGEDFRRYRRTPDGTTLQQLLEERCDPVAPSVPLRPGMIGEFAFPGLYPQHVGLYTDWRGGIGLIHAYAPNRKVVEHGATGLWAAPVRRFYYRGLC